MTLNRRTALTTALAAGTLAGVPKSWAKPRLAYELAPREVADGVWMLEGTTEYFNFENGGNIVNVTFVRTDAGAVIIDSGPSRRYAEELRKIAAETVPSGIAAVVNTHHHPDHFLGNQVFGDVPIHALEQTRALASLHGDGYTDNMYRLLGDWMRGTEAVPPGDVLNSSELTIGGRAFSMVPLAGHSEADLVVLDRQTGTAIAGDLAFLDRAPTTPDADLGLWRESLTAIDALDPSGIVPGHGPFDTKRRSLSQTRAYLDWLDEALTDSAEEGFDMVETMQRDLPPEFADMGAQPQEFERSVSHMFSDYERAALPQVN